MAHSLSAKKRIRQTAKRNARNRARKDLVKVEVKAFTTTLAGGDIAKAAEQLNKTVSRIDRIAAKGTIHKNTAARRRSRLQKRLNVMVAAGGAKPVVEKKGNAKKAAGRGTKATKA